MGPHICALGWMSCFCRRARQEAGYSWSPGNRKERLHIVNVAVKVLSASLMRSSASTAMKVRPITSAELLREILL